MKTVKLLNKKEYCTIKVKLCYIENFSTLSDYLLAKRRNENEISIVHKLKTSYFGEIVRKV